MHAIPADPTTSQADQPGPRPASALDADLRRAQWLATLMDAQFEVVGIKFGLDAIVGLVPGVGDTVAMLVALYPIHVARKHGLGRAVVARMAVNVGVDWLAGAVPLLGDLLDVGFKANLANVRLLEEAVARRRGR